MDWKAVESRQFAMPFAPEPTRTYIAAEFLQLQQEVEHMNYHYDDDHFTSDIADAFEFVRPESRKLLGLDQETPALKPLKKLQPKKHCLKKANLSVALFDREENPTESCSSSEIKTVKGSDGNKENRENRDNQRENRDNQRENLLRRDNSKKALPRQGSQLLLLGKTPTTLHLVPQKSQRVLLTVPAQSHNSSECSRTASRGKDTVRIRISDVREGREKSKGRSREKGLKESSLGKGSMMKKKEEKKTILPTCSYKIKLT